MQTLFILWTYLGTHRYMNVNYLYADLYLVIASYLWSKLYHPVLYSLHAMVYTWYAPRNRLFTNVLSPVTSACCIMHRAMILCEMKNLSINLYVSSEKRRPVFDKNVGGTRSCSVNGNIVCNVCFIWNIKDVLFKKIRTYIRILSRYIMCVGVCGGKY